MKKICFILALATLGACSSDENAPSNESIIRLTSEISSMSRGTDLNQQSTQIERGQQVGITITGAKSEHNNVAWAVGNNGDLNNTGNPIYWGDGEATITAYHPYNAAWNNTTETFTVNTDQTGDGYLNSDLLWATKTASKSDNPVSLTFTHKLAKINVTIMSKDIEDINDLCGASIYIWNTNLNTNFNPITGELSAASKTFQANITAGLTTVEAKTSSAIIIPQTIAAGTLFIQIELGGKFYNYKLPADKTFESGNSYSYTLNLKITTSEAECISSNITDWVNENITGDTEEEEHNYSH